MVPLVSSYHINFLAISLLSAIRYNHSVIALTNVTKSYGKDIVLSDLTLRVDPGSNLCVTGDSGAGKTTLLKLLLGAEHPTSGTVDVDGVALKTLPAAVLQLYRKRVGVIWEEPTLVEHLTLEENVGLPLELLNAPAALTRRNVADLLKRFGLASKARALPKALTKNEKALACIARAIVSAPMVILADEPFKYLDPKEVKVVAELLLNMHHKKTTVVLFTADPANAIALKANVLHLRDGKIAKAAGERKAAKEEQTHSILEDKNEDMMTLSQIARASDMRDELPLSAISSKPTPQGGKRIRITSINSNG